MEDTAVTPPPKQRPPSPDRIVLEVDTLVVIKNIADQLQETFNGIVKLSNKEIANFILQSRAGLLGKAELKAIRDKYFDDVRAAQWALQRLKDAKDSGQQLSLAEILNQIQTPSAKEKPVAELSKVKRKKLGSTPTATADSRPLDEANNAPNGTP